MDEYRSDHDASDARREQDVFWKFAEKDVRRTDKQHRWALSLLFLSLFVSIGLLDLGLYRSLPKWASNGGLILPVAGIVGLSLWAWYVSEQRRKAR